MSFGNLTLLLCKTCGAIFYCFVHGRLITRMKTKNNIVDNSQLDGSAMPLDSRDKAETRQGGLVISNCGGAFYVMSHQHE